MWTGRLPHLSVLHHLPGVTHLHVNRPLKPEKTTDIFQRQQRFPRKMTSAGRNETEGRNSTLLMTYHRPDLGGASDWLKQVSLAP